MGLTVSQLEFEHFQMETEEQNDFSETCTQLKYNENIKEESKNNKYK